MKKIASTIIALNLIGFIYFAVNDDTRAIGTLVEVIPWVIIYDLSEKINKYKNIFDSIFTGRIRIVFHEQKDDDVSF